MILEHHTVTPLMEQHIDDSLGIATLGDIDDNGKPITSSPLPVVGWSSSFRLRLSGEPGACLARIERRPHGLLITIDTQSGPLLWVVPHHFLSIFKTDTLAIHAQEDYLTLRLQGNDDHRFIDCILHDKSRLSDHQSYYGERG
jgi:hypothetical protein